jgi:hypothetical protein
VTGAGPTIIERFVRRCGQTYTHTLSSVSDPSAGIAFTFSAPETNQQDTICFSNVSLVQN